MINHRHISKVLHLTLIHWSDITTIFSTNSINPLRMYTLERRVGISTHLIQVMLRFTELSLPAHRWVDLKSSNLNKILFWIWKDLLFVLLARNMYIGHSRIFSIYTLKDRNVLKFLEFLELHTTFNFYIPIWRLMLWPPVGTSGRNA